jgi:hypothetical protein
VAAKQREVSAEAHPVYHRSEMAARRQPSGSGAGAPPPYSSPARRKSCALIATLTVLADMSTAPTAGERTNPHGARSRAASGIAITNLMG